MIRDREHLPLPVATEPLERRKRPAPAKPRGDKQSHGDRLLKDVTEVETALKRRQAVPIDGLNPANVFKISIETDRSLDDDVLRKLRLVLLAVEPDAAFVVSTEDVTMSEMRQRLTSYRAEGADGPKYGELAAISSISLMEAEDRIGPRLKAHPVEDGMIEALDVELWHWGTRAQCFERIKELEKAMEKPGMGVPDRWIGEGICLARIKTDAETLGKLLEWPAIRLIERRATPILTRADHWHLSANEVVPEPLPDDAVGILVIDSGVASLHPLLAPILGDSQAFPEAFLEKIGGSATDEHGHGTAVAAIAAYGDVAEAVRQKHFQPTARIFSARVLDKNCHYDEDSLIESQLAAAVEYFVREYPIIRVVNLSLGSRDDVLTDSRYQMRFAAVVDELAYQFRDYEIVFVIAAGNLGRRPANAGEEEINAYPRALLTPEARLTDPASAALALTVGGISAGRIDNHHTDLRVARLVAQKAGNPSPFTRSGPGHERAIKPELVAEGGDYLVGTTGNIRDAGVLSANSKIDSGQLFRQWVGTSFACPFVANLAARLSAEYPDFSSNMVRAMLVHSAQLPSELHADFASQKYHAPDVLRVYGYGKPDWQRARLSAKNDVLLLRDETIGLDTFQILELPALPEAFVTTKGKRRVEITLVYDPPTRASRADNYLGVKMEFTLWKNVGLEDLRDAYRKWDREEKAELDQDSGPPGIGDLEGGKIDLQPKATRRHTSTVQHAWIDIFMAGNLRPEQPLYLVLVCQRSWAPSDIERQRFAVIMSLSHENTHVDLHASIRLQPRIQAEIRLRSEQLRLRSNST